MVYIFIMTERDHPIKIYFINLQPELRLYFLILKADLMPTFPLVEEPIILKPLLEINPLRLILLGIVIKYKQEYKT